MITNKDFQKPFVILIDLYSNGHHDHYLRDLVKGLNGQEIDYLIAASPQLLEQLEIDEESTIPIVGKDYLSRFSGVKRQIEACMVIIDVIKRTDDGHPTHIHFLYADWHVSAIALAWIIMHPKATPVLTVHWATSIGLGSSVKQIDFLRRSTHRICLIWLTRAVGAQVIVHHRIIADEISAIVNPDQIGIVPYPVQSSAAQEEEAGNNIRQQFGISTYDKLVLCFGGTRYDKGADLAVRALSRLSTNFHLLVAGEMQDFTAEDLVSIAKSCKVEKRLHIIPGYLSDKESADVFNASDIILLPYRKGFSGQSGPLTIAASVGKPIASADLPVLGNMINEFKLGKIFKAENIESMAEACAFLASWNVDLKDTLHFNDYHSPNNFAREVYENYLKSH